MSNLSEVEDWLSKAKDALEDAKILFDYGKRIGPVSKIYYSAFYCAKALLLLESARHKKHAGVIGAFGKLIVRKNNFPRKYGRFFNKMYDLRQNVDYSTARNRLLRKDLKNLLKTATNFNSAAKAYLNKAMQK